jgi:GntR family transcriptional regulator of arabinose operon
MDKEREKQRNPRSRWSRVVDRIKAQIVEQGVWTPGMRIPAERDLAESYRVSRNTIRKAISVLSSEGYLLSEIGRGTYVNSAQFWGQKNRVNKAKLVSVIITDVKFDFGKKIVRGLENCLNQRGYSLILCQDHSSLEKTRRYVTTLLENSIKGVILDPVLTDNYVVDNRALIEVFEREQIPVVLIDREIPGIETSSVITNNEEVSFKATGYLLQNNHREIVVIRGDSSIIQKRFGGIERAYRQHGIPFSSCRDVLLQTHDDINRDTGILCSILEKMRGYTAIFPLNEYFGKVALRALNKMKKNVPEDVSFITFDHPEDSLLEDGTITYIEQPLQQMADRAAQVLVDLIENKRPPRRQTTIRSKLVLGRSVRALSPAP